MTPSRQNSCKVPISIREWIVCTFATLTLVFTAWSLGGYKTWALHLLFSGGLGTFLAAVLPMPRSWNGYDQQHGNLKNFKRLLAQPFFWASLCFLGYILIQYFNPSIVQVFGEKSWWVKSMRPPLGANMPSSVIASYEEMNALRTFEIQAAAIALASGILVGIQRRKPALIILWSFVISGVTMGFVAILHKFSGSTQLLWLFECINKTPWGSFAYRNQGAAYLILVSMVSGALYFFYLSRSKKYLKEGGPHFICFLFIFLLYSSIWLALSRGGIILGSILFLIVCILAFFHNIKYLSFGRSWISTSVCLTIILIGSVFMTQFFNWPQLSQRVNNLVAISQNVESYDRTLSTKATWEMAQDRLTYGWGAGSFRYIFPIYQKNYNSIWYYKYNDKRGWYWRKIYNYAHNDWVQFVAEYGIVGCLFLGGMFLCLISATVSLFFFNKSSGFIMFGGLMLIFVHNFVDFIFSSPAYWIAFWGSFFLICKLFQLESKAKLVRQV